MRPLLLTLALPLALALAKGHTPCTPSDPKLGAVASESSICSRVGTEFLSAGGNAVDAMVGTVLCVGTVGMYHSGLGGGGFMLVRSKEGGYEFIDFRETAPAAAFEEMYVNNTGLSLFGGLASGVPGELRGLEYLHNKYGSLPWKDVFAPAIKLARDGFTVTQDLVDYMDGLSNPEFLVTEPTWALDFAPRGTRVQLGDTMTRKRYAATLETIATYGAEAFYIGPIANATIETLQSTGGTMTLEDLANYTVALREPAEVEYRGYKVRSCSAPSGGIVALSALNIMDEFEGFSDPGSVNFTTHRMDEAMRFAYAQRTKLGDPLFVNGLDAYQTSMLSAATAEEIKAKISDFTTQNTSYYDPEGLESLETPGTSHIATADASGLAVSLTTTINLIFGSRVMVPSTGVIMNNEMNDFSIPGSSNAFGYIPSPANYVRPGKRPLSSISPTIVETPEGRLYFVIGAAGGSRIITATIQNVHNVVDLGFGVADALKAPRLHDQLVPNQVRFEWAYGNDTVKYMEGLGHNVTFMAPGSSAAQGVRLLENGTFEAAGEPRQEDSGGFAV